MNGSVRPLGLLLLLCTGLAWAATPVEFERQYVNGTHGQVHVLKSMPLTRKALRTPMACFAPNPASGNYFRLFMGELGQDRIMIAPDYPGLGQSDPSPEPMDMAGYTAAMAEALEALGYGADGKGALDVCGYHTGAYVALELAVSRPDLVRRVLLLGIPYYDEAGRQRMYEENVYPRPIGEELSHLQGSWDFAVTNRNDGVSLERAYANFLDVAKASTYRPWAYHAAFSYAAEERAPLVTQPVLILNTHGSLAEETREIAPMSPDVELVEVPELHHGVFDVGAERLSELARPFLDRP